MTAAPAAAPCPGLQAAHSVLTERDSICRAAGPPQTRGQGLDVKALGDDVDHAQYATYLELHLGLPLDVAAQQEHGDAVCVEGARGLFLGGLDAATLGDEGEDLAYCAASCAGLGDIHADEGRTAALEVLPQARTHGDGRRLQPGRGGFWVWHQPAGKGVFAAHELTPSVSISPMWRCAL